MTYLEPLGAGMAVFALGFGVVAGFLGDTVLRRLSLAGVAGMGFIVAATNFQTTGRIVALIAAYAFVVIGGLELKAVRNRPGRKERRLWAQLFPQIGFWGMIKHDPRRNNS